MGDSLVLLRSGNIEGIIDHDGAHVNVIVCSGRSMDDHRSPNAVAILCHGVRVIPARSVLVQLHRVATGRARSNTALGDAWNTVLVVGTFLCDT